jgi:hypothetical protein
MTTNNPNPPAPSAAGTGGGPGVASSAPLAQPTAVDHAMNALSLEVLQAERAKMLDHGKTVRRSVDVSSYDRAIAAKGGQGVDPAAARDYEAHGVAPTPATGDYKFNLPALRESANLAEVHALSRQWSSDLKLAPNTAANVVERISSVSAQLAKMDENARANWEAQQQETLLRALKSPEAVAKMKADALEAPKLSGTDISKGLAQHPVLNDPAILVALGTHHRALALLKAKGR